MAGGHVKQLEPEFDTPHPQRESSPQQDKGTTAGSAAGSSSLQLAGPGSDLGKGA